MDHPVYIYIYISIHVVIGQVFLQKVYYTANCQFNTGNNAQNKKKFNLFILFFFVPKFMLCIL